MKKILLASGSIFLAFQSYSVLSFLNQVEINSIPMIIFLAWVINMLITGIFAFSGFALPTQKLMPQSYYTVSRPKILAHVYKVLGVNTFRKFLLATFWRDKEKHSKYFNGTSSGISSFAVQSKKSEFGHVIPFLILNIIAIYWCATDHVMLGVATFLFNVFGNFYPVILQRHHRMRIQRISARYDAK